MERAFTHFAGKSADLAGRPKTFVIVCVLVLAWALSGPYYHYSDTWQLIINTSTTIITCLLCLLIQASANRSEMAVQTKLDELLRSNRSAHKTMIGIEHMTLTEIEILRNELETAVRKKLPQRPPQEWR